MNDDFPNNGDLVLVTIKKIFPHCAFAILDEFGDKEGMIHISEVASSWVRNIRNFIKENKKEVCKVLEVDKKKNHISLSLKRVSKADKKRKLEDLKQQKRAENLIERVAESLKVDKVEVSKIMAKIEEQYGSLYYYLYDIATKTDENIVDMVDISDKWKKAIKTMAIENIKPPVYVIKRELVLRSEAPDGIDVIKKAFSHAKDLNVIYLGAGKYKLELESLNPKQAEQDIDNVCEAIINDVVVSNGEGKIIE